MIWGRRAGKDESGRVRKIPGLVQMGLVIGDLVEVEDWNEYGELKQHVTIYHEGGTPARTTPAGTPSKAPVPAPAVAPVTQENKKPEPPTSAGVPKSVVEEKPAAAPQPSPISLALRQAGQEAAQKAKDGKKGAMQVLSGVGKAEPPKDKEKEKAKAIPSPVQSPNSIAWKTTADGRRRASGSEYAIDDLESLQSPNSTAWKPSDIDGPILMHRGSTVSTASAEEIKQIEDEEAIPEEDEEDDEEDEDEEEEEDDEDDDDDDDDDEEDSDDKEAPKVVKKKV